LFTEACQIFFPQLQLKAFYFYEIKGGVNNWTKGVITPQGDYVVRIYNNGKNIDKVKL
jgi:homoserine kinase type II